MHWRQFQCNKCNINSFQLYKSYKSTIGTVVGELAYRQQCPFNQESSGGWKGMRPGHWLGSVLRVAISASTLPVWHPAQEKTSGTYLQSISSKISGERKLTGNWLTTTSTVVGMQNNKNHSYQVTLQRVSSNTEQFTCTVFLYFIITHTHRSCLTGFLFVNSN